MTHLLLVSYSGGIQKCRTVAGLARNHGYEVTMLTTSIAPGLEDDLPGAVNVHEVADPKPISVYRPAWVLAARSTARHIVERRDVDAVLSWHVPIASHVLAALTTRGRSVPWVAHFGDPWLGNPYATGLLRSIIYSKSLERYVVTAADRVTMPTDRMRTMYEDRYDLAEDRIRVVPNNIDPAEVRRVDPHEFDDDRLRFVHTGSFYGPRTPEPLFAALDRLNPAVREDTAITLVGSLNKYEDSIAAHGVGDVVEAVGRVPKDDALAYAKGSDVLVLVDAPVENSPFLPTKLAEYVFMDRPILGVTPDPGTSADVIQATETGVVTPPSDPAAIADGIATFHERAADGTLGVTPDDEARRQYTSEAAVGRLAGVLADLV